MCHLSIRAKLCPPGDSCRRRLTCRRDIHGAAAWARQASAAAARDEIADYAGMREGKISTPACVIKRVEALLAAAAKYRRLARRGDTAGFR